MFVVEFEELVTRVEASLEQASPSRRRTRAPSSRSRLRRSMVKDHPVFELFVSGSSSGVETAFFCTLCQRDVYIAAKGECEILRHFASDKHWSLEVIYRVHQGLQVYNKLLDPMELSEAQTQEYLSRPFREKPEGFSFPEDLLPPCTRVDSSVPLMTMVNCLVELLRSGGDYLLLRKLWGHFRATLGSENPLYSLAWSRGESLVRLFSYWLTSSVSSFLLITIHSFGSLIVLNDRDQVWKQVSKYLLCVSVVIMPGSVPSGSPLAGRPRWRIQVLQCCVCGTR